MNAHPLPLAVLVFVVGLLADTCQPIAVRAQGADVGLLLARVAVHEAGFWRPADHRAIAAITVRQARRRGMELDTWIVRRFTRALRPAEELPGRRYIAGLSRSQRKPEHWRDDLNDWEGEYAPLWMTTLRNVDDVIARGGRGECLATIWGSPEYDRDEIEEKLANGWEIVDCGDTSNVYLRRVP